MNYQERIKAIRSEKEALMERVRGLTNEHNTLLREWARDESTYRLGDTVEYYGGKEMQIRGISPMLNMHGDLLGWRLTGVLRLKSGKLGKKLVSKVVYI